MHLPQKSVGNPADVAASMTGMTSGVGITFICPGAAAMLARNVFVNFDFLFSTTGNILQV